MPARKPQSDHETGSPASGEPAYLAVGFLRRPHGVRGEIQMDVLTDFPERLEPGALVYVGDDHRQIEILSLRMHGKAMLVRLQDCQTPEQAGLYRNQYLFVRADDRPPLPEGEYYHHQLIGLSVVTDDGRALGRLAEILETGANDVYVVVDDSGGESLLPAIPPVVLRIDLEAQIMTVHLLPGLLGEQG